MKIAPVETYHMDRVTDMLKEVELPLTELLKKENPGLYDHYIDQMTSLLSEYPLSHVHLFSMGFTSAWLLIREAMKDEGLN